MRSRCMTEPTIMPVCQSFFYSLATRIQTLLLKAIDENGREHEVMRKRSAAAAVMEEEAREAIQ